MGACNGKSDPPLTDEAAEPQKSVSPEIKDDDPIPMSEDDIERSDAPPFPTIKSTHSLVAKHVTPEKWAKLGGLKTKTSGFTLGQAIACAVQFDDQHCGIYAGDQDSYEDFADVFDPLILEYHGLKPGFKHQSNMNVDEIKGEWWIPGQEKSHFELKLNYHNWPFSKQL